MNKTASKNAREGILDKNTKLIAPRTLAALPSIVVVLSCLDLDVREGLFELFLSYQTLFLVNNPL